MARTLVSMMAGYILQLTFLGPDAVGGVPDAIRALWPRAAAGPRVAAPGAPVS